MLKAIRSFFDKKTLESILNEEDNAFKDLDKNLEIEMFLIIEIEDGDIVENDKINYKDHPIFLLGINIFWDENEMEFNKKILEKNFRKNLANKDVWEIDDDDWTENYFFKISNFFNVLFLPPLFELEIWKNKFIKTFLENEKDKNIKYIENLNNELKQNNNELLKKENFILLREHSKASYDNVNLQMNFLETNGLEEIKKISFEFEKESNNKFYNDLGDGYNKCFSIIFGFKEAEIKLKWQDKKKFIVFWEEPENNLSILWQNKFINYVKKEFSYEENIGKFFYTTHSASQIHLNYGKKIFINLEDGQTNIGYFSREDFYSGNKNAIKRLSPLENIKVSNAIFYKNIFMVEGFSEEIFYSFIYSYNEEYRNFIDSKEIFVLNVATKAPSYKYNNFFKNLNKKVVMKIDNDIHEKKNPSLVEVWNQIQKNHKNISDEELKIITDKIKEINDINKNSYSKTDEEKKAYYKKINEIIKSVNNDKEIFKIMEKEGYFVSKGTGSFEEEFSWFLKSIGLFSEKLKLSNSEGKTEKLRTIIEEIESNEEMIEKISSIKIDSLKNESLFKWMSAYEE